MKLLQVFKYIFFQVYCSVYRILYSASIELLWDQQTSAFVKFYNGNHIIFCNSCVLIFRFGTFWGWREHNYFYLLHSPLFEFLFQLIILVTFNVFKVLNLKNGGNT